MVLNLLKNKLVNNYIIMYRRKVNDKIFARNIVYYCLMVMNGDCLLYTSTQTGTMGMTQGNDSVSKNIQNQIANAQQKLQDLSSNEDVYKRQR